MVLGWSSFTTMSCSTTLRKICPEVTNNTNFFCLWNVFVFGRIFVVVTLSVSVSSGQYIWIKTLIDILKDYQIYYFSGKSIAIIHLRNQNNNSCDMEQMEYKISEFQLKSIFGKTLRPFFSYLYIIHETTDLTWNKKQWIPNLELSLQIPKAFLELPSSGTFKVVRWECQIILTSSGLPLQ